MRRFVMVTTIAAWIGAGTTRAADVEPLLVDGFDSGSTCLWSLASPDHVALEISPLGDLESGSTATGSSGIEGSCTGAGRERIYRITGLSPLQSLYLRLTPQSADLGLYLSQGCPAAAATTELRCEDQSPAGKIEGFVYVVGNLDPPLYITIDGFSVDDAGAYELDVATSLCGNAIREESEACDGPDLDGEDCISFGYSGGNLLCDGTCEFDFSGCVP